MSVRPGLGAGGQPAAPMAWRETRMLQPRLWAVVSRLAERPGQQPCPFLPGLAGSWARLGQACLRGVKVDLRTPALSSPWLIIFLPGPWAAFPPPRAALSNPDTSPDRQGQGGPQRPPWVTIIAWNPQGLKTGPRAYSPGPPGLFSPPRLARVAW